MADLHKAIRAIHNDVVHVRGETKENIVAKDIDEKDKFLILNKTLFEVY